MVIFIHKSSIKPIASLDEIVLPVGFETNIAINEVKYRKLPPPHDNCSESFDSDLYINTTRIHGVYRQKFCMLLCQ